MIAARRSATSKGMPAAALAVCAKPIVGTAKRAARKTNRIALLYGRSKDRPLRNTD
jgi:hypothetical protein